MPSHFSCVWLFASLWSIAWQALLFVGFFRQEYWSGFPCHPPGDPSDPGIEPTSPVAPALKADFFFFITEPPWKLWHEAHWCASACAFVLSYPLHTVTNTDPLSSLLTIIITSNSINRQKMLRHYQVSEIILTFLYISIPHYNSMSGTINVAF